MTQEHGSRPSASAAITPFSSDVTLGVGATSAVEAIYPSEFIHKLQSTINIRQKDNGSGALLLVSIDNLAMIINGYGHEFSERTVSGLIALMSNILSKDDSIARLQRDQFGIILARSHPGDTESTAARLANIVQNYGREHYATSSLHVIGAVGAVHFPQETQSASDALDKAYVALNSPQESFLRVYSDMHQEADACRQQMGLASYLYSAMHENRLRLAWQPIVESKTGRIAHYEGLLRLIGLNGKVTSAGALIPVAEKMGLIEPIDTMVLDMIAKELRTYPNVSLAFNVSNLTTENPIWLERLQTIIQETPDIAPRMIVEITETAMHANLRRAAYFVAAIQSLGAQVALDDFGSGYTSFRQIKALSVDMVKIDGVFIKDLAYNADNRFFVKTLLEFTHGFGLPSVAEFVETGDTAKLLMEYGMEYMQGYYFGKPENTRRWVNTGEYSKD